MYWLLNKLQCEASLSSAKVEQSDGKMVVTVIKTFLIEIVLSWIFDTFADNIMTLSYMATTGYSTLFGVSPTFNNQI